MDWYRLRCVGLSDTNIRALLKLTKNYFEIFKIDNEQLRKYLKFNDEDLKKIEKSKDVDLIEEINKLSNSKVKLLFIEDEAYPESLKNIAQPPVFLYCRGDVKKLNNFNIAVVGTRKSSSYGRGVCEKMVDGLVKAGVTTVSGLALGIDTICHKKTIEKQGTTIAVVGSGLDVIYPKENRELWDLIPKHGVLISEYPLGTEPLTYHFPLRNRIIVGLSRGVVIAESRDKGGSLITAEYALEENREVFAVPGEIFSPFSAGCNNLIKNSQAKLITKIEDVLDEYGITIESESNVPKIQLNNFEKKVYDSLIGARTLDEIIGETGMKPTDILAVLVDLEIKQQVVSIAGGAYRRKN